MVKKFIVEQLKDIDAPLPEVPGLFRKKKIRVVILNEDGSYNEFYRKHPPSYTFDIGKRSYILIPKAFLKGKYPSIYYFFNNPFPIMFTFQYSQLKALDLRSEEQKKDLSEADITSLDNITIDAETLNLAFNTRTMKGLYSEGGVSTKTIIIILVVVAIIVLIFLQVFGVVDVIGGISGAAGGKT